jgi:hypothetical protein
MRPQTAIAAKWIELFDSWRSDPARSNLIAAISVPPADKRTILYVGKATSKDRYRDDKIFGPPSSGKDAAEARIKERHRCTRKFLAEEAPTYSSGFWRLAKEINTEAAAKWGIR